MYLEGRDIWTKEDPIGLRNCNNKYAIYAGAAGIKSSAGDTGGKILTNKLTKSARPNIYLRAIRRRRQSSFKKVPCDPGSYDGGWDRGLRIRNHSCERSIPTKILRMHGIYYVRMCLPSYARVRAYDFPVGNIGGSSPGSRSSRSD